MKFENKGLWFKESEDADYIEPKEENILEDDELDTVEDELDSPENEELAIADEAKKTLKDYGYKPGDTFIVKDLPRFAKGHKVEIVTDAYFNNHIQDYAVDCHDLTAGKFFGVRLDWLPKNESSKKNEGLYVDPANYGNYNDLVDVVDKEGNPQKMTRDTYDKNKDSDEFEKKEPKSNVPDEVRKGLEGRLKYLYNKNYGRPDEFSIVHTATADKEFVANATEKEFTDMLDNYLDDYDKDDAVAQFYKWKDKYRKILGLSDEPDKSKEEQPKELKSSEKPDKSKEEQPKELKPSEEPNKSKEEQPKEDLNAKLKKVRNTNYGRPNYFDVYDAVKDEKELFNGSKEDFIELLDSEIGFTRAFTRDQASRMYDSIKEKLSK